MVMRWSQGQGEAAAGVAGGTADVRRFGGLGVGAWCGLLEVHAVGHVQHIPDAGSGLGDMAG